MHLLWYGEGNLVISLTWTDKLVAVLGAKLIPYSSGLGIVLTVGLKGKHGKKNVAAVLSMEFFEDNPP